MPRKYAIVGSGIAGLVAAETIRRREPSADIQMISEEKHNFYSRPGLAYLLRRDIPERQLYIRNRMDARELGLQRINDIVDEIRHDRHELLLAGGQSVAYDRLLLATGALANPPSFEGGNLAGVVKLDSLDDARRIIKLSKRRRPAVVVGGGITALELAEGLNARGMKVHYFLRGDRYWADVLDETESHIVQERLRHEGVILHTQTQVKQAIGDRGVLKAVETQAGETIPCHMLAVAIGVRPRIDLAVKAGLKVDRGILVDEYLRTSVEDVFAAGDAAQVFDPHSGRATLDVLWPTALLQGQAAGANMTGANIAYIKGVAFNVTQLTGLKVTIIGAVGTGKDQDLVTIARGDSEAWRVSTTSEVLTKRDDVNRIRLVIGERQIVGALIMGDQTWSRPLQQLIVGKADISPIRPALMGNDHAALARLADFFDEWERAGARRCAKRIGELATVWLGWR